MENKIEFRMITTHLKEAVIGVSNLLKRDGFKICDLKESRIIGNPDGIKTEDIYILFCEGTIEGYERFKHKHELREMIYKGYKTLM